MTQKRSLPSKLPKLRADAQRNRGRILEVAREAFTRSGADASLDDIAKQAGVGPGTLYRHFPTREELLKAVYRKELETLAADSDHVNRGFRQKVNRKNARVGIVIHMSE